MVVISLKIIPLFSSILLLLSTSLFSTYTTSIALFLNLTFKDNKVKADSVQV